MVHFEKLAKERALVVGIRFPLLWLRYVDDVLAFWEGTEKELSDLLLFLNGLRSSISFKVEVESEGRLPFLDVLIERRSAGLSFSVFRKKTHTDRYLCRDSAHPVGVFKSLVRSLSKRAQTICSGHYLKAERSRVFDSLHANGYDQAECRKWWPTSDGVQASVRKKREESFKGAIPYVPGTSEKIRDVLQEIGVKVAMKPVSTLRKQLVRKRPRAAERFGVVYRLCCASEGCRWNYVGESGRTMEERRKEHARAVKDVDVARSEVAQHVHEESHQVDFNGMEVIDREPDWRKRVVKEALWTRKFSSSNRTKHTLSDFWCL